MNFKSKVKVFWLEPTTRKAYLRWLLHRMIFGQGPFVDITEQAKIGGWKKFSEFLSFQTPISAAEFSLMRRLIDHSERMCVLDIGANLGAFSVFFCTQGCHRVHAFEAVPETFLRLVTNVQRHDVLGSVVCNCLAVSDHTGVVTLKVQSDSPATNRVVSRGEGSPGKDITFQRVGAISLDQYCADAKIGSCDFVKIDVEGHEPMVLRGANRLYREGCIGVTLLEICPQNLEQVGFSVEDLFGEIKNSLCNAFRLNEDGSIGKLLSLDDLKAISLENVVLLPEKSHVRG